MLQLGVVFGKSIKKAVKQVSLSLYPLLCSVCDVQWHMPVCCDLQIPLPKAVTTVTITSPGEVDRSEL